MTLNCPACAHAELKPFQDRFDINNRLVKLKVCGNCTAIINFSDYEVAASNLTNALNYQEQSSIDFYTISQELIDSIPERTSACGGIVESMLSITDRPIPRGRIVDLGAGFGFLAAGACDYFDESWAVEINQSTLSEMLPHFNRGEKLKVAGSLDAIPGPISAVIMWHTVEHLVDPLDVAQKIAARLEQNGAFFWQVPAYRDPYVVESHYTFFNENAIRIFCKNMNLTCEGIFHDLENQFITCLARKF